MEFKQMITSVVPKAFGEETPPSKENANPYFLNAQDSYLYWDTAFFFGCTTLVLGLFGILTLGKRREGKFLVVMALFGFLFALGSNGVVFPLFFKLPFFNSLRAPARMMFYFSFGCCILAGFGFDTLVKNVKKKKLLSQFLKAAIVPLVIAIGVSLGILVSSPDQLHSALTGNGLLAISVTLASLIVGYLFIREKVTLPVAGICFLSLIFLDLFVATGKFNNNATGPSENYRSFLSPALKQTLTAKPPTDIFRVSARGKLVNALSRNQGLVDSIMMFEGYNQLLLAKRHPKAKTQTGVFDLLGIKYQAAYDSVKNEDYFVPREGYFPNAWMVYRVLQAMPDSVQMVMQQELSYRDVAVTEEPLAKTLSDKPSSQVNHAISCQTYSDNRIEYKVSTAEAGLLCLSEIWYPAWHASVDGKEAAVHRINYCLRGIEVPAGVHTVMLNYESSAFASGAIISGATLLLSLGGLAAVMVTNRKRKKPTDETDSES